MLANTQIYKGNNELAFMYIQEGVMHSLNVRDFRMVGYYSRLASLNYTFKSESLRQLYEMLQLDAITERMTPHEYQTYMFEMDRIKRLLIDRPFGQAQMRLSVETDIGFDEVEDSKIVSSLFSTVQKAAPQSVHHLEVRLNSPYWFDLLISGSPNDLCTYCGYFFGGFMALTTMAASYYKLVNLVYDKQLKKIDIETKRFDLEQKKRQRAVEKADQLSQRLLQQKADAALPVADRVVGVSVSFNDVHEIPDGLRKFSLKKN